MRKNQEVLRGAYYYKDNVGRILSAPTVKKNGRRDIMSRKKEYFKHEIPSSVVGVVCAICADYARRESAMKHGVVSGEVLDRYAELNQIIECALMCIEAELREDLLVDIAEKRGFERSRANLLLSKNAYYRRRRRVIFEIAMGLRLCEENPER